MDVGVVARRRGMPTRVGVQADQVGTGLAGCVRGVGAGVVGQFHEGLLARRVRVDVVGHLLDPGHARRGGVRGLVDQEVAIHLRVRGLRGDERGERRGQRGRALPVLGPHQRPRAGWQVVHRRGRHAGVVQVVAERGGRGVRPALVGGVVQRGAVRGGRRRGARWGRRRQRARVRGGRGVGRRRRGRADVGRGRSRVQDHALVRGAVRRGRPVPAAARTDEGPVVGVRVQGQPQHPVVGVVPGLQVRWLGPERVELVPAGAGLELADAAGRGVARAVLLGPALVGVVVGREHQVGLRGQQVVPQRTLAGVLPVLGPGVVAREVQVGQVVQAGVGRQVRLQPPLLRRARRGGHAAGRVQ